MLKLIGFKLVNDINIRAWTLQQFLPGLQPSAPTNNKITDAVSF